MYNLSNSNATDLENKRRKYVYMIGCMMGGRNDWRGGTMLEIHQSTREKEVDKNKCPFSSSPSGLGEK